MDNINYKNITFYEFLDMTVQDIKNHTYRTYYWMNGDEELKEIVEFDLFSERIVMDDQDFSEFDWEIEESRIYVKEFIN